VEERFTRRVRLCDETDPEYEFRYDADEEYVRELIDRIDEMSLRGVKLQPVQQCHQKWKGLARRSARGVIGKLSGILFCGGSGCGADGCGIG